VEPVEQLPAARVGEGLEDLVDVGGHSVIMQPFSCLSSAP
jgi:hypothetical protein